MFCIQTLVFLLLVSLDDLSKISCQQDSSTFPLSDKSFSITSVISTLDVNEENPYGQVRLTEHYSIDQRRAKLKFDQDHKLFANLHNNYELTYDAIIGAGISLDLFDSKCNAISPSEIIDLILPKQKLTFELLQLAGQDQDLGYVIGPARLLFLIASRADQMKLSKSESSVPKTTRNVPIVMYRLDVALSGGKTATLYIYYSQLTFFPDSIRTSIPILVYIDFSDYGLKIDYYGHQIIAPTRVHSHYVSDARMAARSSADQTMDMFAFPVSLNCDKFLGDGNHENLFAQYDITALRFSFTTTDDEQTKPPSTHFVAFDGMIHSMRIDHKQRRFIEDTYRTNTVLLDFQANRKYIIQDAGSSRKSLMKSLGTGGSECVVTNIVTPEKRDPRRQIKLANFLFGPHKFAYMGLAQVRGLAARVYESNSTTWPYWLSRPMLFKTENGDYETREKDQLVREGHPKPSSELYSILIYLVDSEPEDISINGLRILQLEVYSLKDSPRSSYRRILRSQFHDFMWDLTNAPNGDKASELFSHIELCSAGDDKENGGNRYAKVDLLLEQDATSETGNVDWIENWLFRNDALSSSFRDVLNVQNFMMYDLESKLIKHHYGANETRRFIEASFRIADPPHWLHHVSYVGNARLNDPRSTFVLHEAQTPADCLWLAGESHPNLYFYYSDMSNACVIDLDLTRADEADISKSKAFELKPDGISELYRVERRRDTEVASSNTWLRDQRGAHLEHRVMYLQHIQTHDLSHPIDPNQLMVRIKKIKVNNVNFMKRPDPEGRQILSPASVYPGFGLVISEESKSFVKRASLRGGAKMAGDDSLTVMTREQCQTECLADMSCRAYSYCVRASEEECLLSSLGFDGPGVREHLESRLVQRSRQGSPISLTVGDFNATLMRDFKCELHNKIHMDLFKRSWPSITTLKGLQVFQVSNEEQCAEICFRKSLDSIKSSLALSDQLRRALSAGATNAPATVEELEELRQKHRLEMTKFCQYFMYLDSFVDEHEAVLKRRLANKADLQDATKSWWCIMDRDYSSGDDKDEETDITYFQMTTFKFDFAKLFEKRYDFGLKGSDFSEEEHNAYMLAGRGESLEMAQYELLRKTVADGKNYQLEINADENNCAQQCFMQSSTLWPACRSFDVAKVSRFWRESVDFVCFLNTESFNTEKVVNEVKSTRRTNIQLWHYEPRFGLAQQEVDNAYKLDEAVGQPAASAISGHRATSIGLPSGLLVALLGIMSGLTIGLLMTRRFVGSFEQENKVTEPVTQTPYQRHQDDNEI